MAPATWANKKNKCPPPPTRSSAIHLDFISAYPPLWTVFTDSSVPPAEAFLSTGNLLFCLGLLPVDSWDSCCRLHWKPFLLQRDGMSGQAAAGWAQRLPAVNLCQWPSHPWLSSGYRGRDQSRPPGVSVGRTRGPTALICCSCWKCLWWLNIGMKSKWIIVMQDCDRDDFGWTGWILSLPWDSPCLSSQFSLLWFCAKSEDGSSDCAEIIWQSPPCLLFPEILPELTGEQGCTNCAFICFQTSHRDTWNGKLV